MTGRTPAEELAEVIAGQVIAYVGECVCDEAYTSRNLTDPNCQWHALGDDFASETAAMVLAHLTAEGWAQGREEWGVQYERDVVPMPDEATARKELRELDYAKIMSLVRRRVSAWAPVETGAAPDA